MTEKIPTIIVIVSIIGMFTLSIVRMVNINKYHETHCPDNVNKVMVDCLQPHTPPPTDGSMNPQALPKTDY